VTRGATSTATPAAVDATELARDLIRAASPNPPGDERAVAAVIDDAAEALRLPPPQRIERDARRPNLLMTATATRRSPAAS
jgi:hypothetical protein